MLLERDLGAALSWEGLGHANMVYLTLWVVKRNWDAKLPDLFRLNIDPNGYYWSELPPVFRLTE